MSELPLNQVLCGDCVEVLKGFPDNSIDLVVTDPPYGLSFMGKDWDKALPSKEAFTEIIRVLKPGALAFVMSSPRQDLLWRMLALLEDVGFELTQSYIDWIYKTGFPKAYDVSKGIDKRKGGLIDRSSLGAFILKQREKTGLSRQDASELVTGNRTGAFWNWENNYCVPIPELWPKIKEVIKAPDSEWDEKLSRAKREKVGESDNPISWFDDGQSFDITKPALDASKKWSGWKSQTGLKPAHEPILMVNKPFSESTIVDNVLRWGTGAINVDHCRIPFDGEPQPTGSAKRVFKSNQYTEEKIYGNNTTTPIAGRFPANLLVSDKALDTGKTTKSTGGITKGKLGNRVYGQFENINPQAGEGGYGDIGDQSRYFDLDAWAEHHGFLDVAKPSREERNFGLWGMPEGAPPGSKRSKPAEGRRNPLGDPRANYHPTVKPIKLMAYLIELGCPPDGVVLDPFVGSGTTCIAAKKLVRKYVGIEINPEYVALAEARIRAYPVPFDWFTEEDSRFPPNRRIEE